MFISTAVLRFQVLMASKYLLPPAPGFFSDHSATCVAFLEAGELTRPAVWYTPEGGLNDPVIWLPLSVPMELAPGSL